jgi:hypothetical protein
VTSATLQRLTEAERLATPEGAVALHLARLIDLGDYNAQGAAALAKAHAEAWPARRLARSPRRTRSTNYWSAAPNVAAPEPWSRRPSHDPL